MQGSLLSLEMTFSQADTFCLAGICSVVSRSGLEPQGLLCLSKPTSRSPESPSHSAVGPQKLPFHLVYSRVSQGWGTSSFFSLSLLSEASTGPGHSVCSKSDCLQVEFSRKISSGIAEQSQSHAKGRLQIHVVMCAGVTCLETRSEFHISLVFTVCRGLGKKSFRACEDTYRP